MPFPLSVHSTSKLIGIVVPLGLCTLLVACGGGEREPDPRAARGIVVKDYGFVSDSSGNVGRVKDGVWQRPAVVIEAVTTVGDQTDITTCDFTYPTDTMLGSTVDSTCFVTGTSAIGDECLISSGSSRYSGRLGYFTVEFINNSTSVYQNLLLDGYGVNLRIVNAAGADVWNLAQDSADYQDILAEAGNLFAAEGGAECAGKIRAGSSGDTLTSLAYFGTAGEPVSYVLTPPTEGAVTLSLSFAWDGKDALGNDVPAGTYTAYFDVTTTDADTGELWETPAPLTFTISD